MKYCKPATTVEEQIDRLQARGLQCDRARVAQQLQACGYYRLSAYWLPFELPCSPGTTRTKEFREGTSFDEILALYTFDRELRQLTLKCLEVVEIAVRAAWVHHFTLCTKKDAHTYLDAKCFRNRGKTHKELVVKLESSIRYGREKFISHYFSKYTEPRLPPLWAVAETMSFGELSKWFSATANPRIKDAVARSVGVKTGALLEGVLHSLTRVRNICAHHSRLWNRKFSKRLPAMRSLRNDFVFEKESGETTNRIYNVFVVLVYMLREIDSRLALRSELTGLLESASVDHLRAMGFPDDWRERPAWRVARPD